MLKKSAALVQSNNPGPDMPNTSLFSELDTATLEKVAAHYRGFLEELQLKISEKKIQEARRADREKHFRELENQLQTLKYRLDQGHDFHKTIAELAGPEQWQRDGLAARFQLRLRDNRKKNRKWAREARRAAAIRLAQTGMTNDEIAETLGCHRNTVSRDIQKSLRENWNTAYKGP